MFEIEGIAGFEGDGPREECGIVAVVSVAENAGRIACQAIQELDNRGKEATGVVVFDNDNLVVNKGFGTGRDVFHDDGLGYVITHPDSRDALGHARYSTQGNMTLNAAQPQSGVLYELTAIAAVVIGGANLSGGKGSIIGTFMGVFILGVINNGLSIMNVPSYYQYIIIGLIVVLSVLINNNFKIIKNEK